MSWPDNPCPPLTPCPSPHSTPPVHSSFAECREVGRQVFRSASLPDSCVRSMRPQWVRMMEVLKISDGLWNGGRGMMGMEGMKASLSRVAQPFPVVPGSC